MANASVDVLLDLLSGRIYDKAGRMVMAFACTWRRCVLSWRPYSKAPCLQSLQEPCRRYSMLSHRSKITGFSMLVSLKPHATTSVCQDMAKRLDTVVKEDWMSYSGA